MNNNNSVVAIYPSHMAAEAAVKELQQSGFDMKKLSIVGRDYHTEQHVVGYYNVGDRMKHWGKIGAFWGWIWAMLVRLRVLFHPRHRAVAHCRAARRLACRGAGKRGRGWRSERARGRLVQLGHPEGQHTEV